MRRRIHHYMLAIIVIVITLTIIAGITTAQAQSAGDFSLQVTPSPLVATAQPGKTTELELKIRNGGSQVENLIIEPRRFSFDDITGKVRLDDTKPPEAAPWVSFSMPTFAIQPGQWFTQKVRITPPADAGFSYSFALVIKRADAGQSKQKSGGILEGSIAVFTLINVDRAGANRRLEVVKFSTGKGVYEILPAELKVKIKNTGNTIVQPAGDVFIQRGSDDAVPISTLPVNKNGSYILPGSTRTLTVPWSSGFQVNKSITAQDGSVKSQLTWNWSDLSKLRIGRYTAKLVMVYNDGQRDIPVLAEVTFWVLPWKLLLIVLLIVLLVLTGLWVWWRTAVRVVRQKARHQITRQHRRNPSDKS